MIGNHFGPVDRTVSVLIDRAYPVVKAVYLRLDDIKIASDNLDTFKYIVENLHLYQQAEAVAKVILPISENLDEILKADDNAAIASQSAVEARKYYELSKQWAIQLETPVAGEDYSSKYWALKAGETAELIAEANENAEGLIARIDKVEPVLTVVEENIEDVTKTANNIDIINIVASDLQGDLIEPSVDVDMGMVGDEDSSLPPVAITGGNIKDVADSIKDVNLVADNMPTIQHVSDSIKEFPTIEEKINSWVEDSRESAEAAKQSEENALASENAAKSSENLAKDWANKLGDTVDGKEYSSKYYAQESKKFSEESNSFAQKSAQSAAEAQEDREFVEENTQIIVDNLEHINAVGSDLELSDSAANLIDYGTLGQNNPNHPVLAGGSIATVAKNIESIIEVANALPFEEGSIDNEILKKLQQKVQELSDTLNECVQWLTVSQDRKAIQLPNHNPLIGTKLDGSTVNLAMVSKWDIADFGSSSLSMNLNSLDGKVTINDADTVVTDKDLETFYSSDQDYGLLN